MTTVAKLTIQMAADVARLKTDMDKAQRTVSGAMGNITSMANKAKNAIGAIGAVLAAGAALKGMTDFISKAINAADAMDELSERTGVAIKDLAGLQLAYQQGGIGSEALQMSLVKLSVAMANGNKAFDQMGVSVRSNDGSLKSHRVILGEIADKFAGYSDGAAKAALAVQIFGKSGADMIPLLNAGSKSLDEFDQMARKLGLTVSDETAKKAAQFNDTLELVQLSSTGLSRQIMAELLPTLNALVAGILKSVTSGDRLKTTAQTIGTAFKGLVVILQVVIEALKQVVMFFTAFWKVTFQTSMGWINGLKKALTGDFSGALSTFNQGLISSLNTFKDYGKNVVTSLGETADAIGTTITGVGAESIETLAAMRKAEAPIAEDAEKLNAIKKHQLLIQNAIRKAMEEEAAYIIKITAMREKAFADQLESADKINESLEKEIESSRRQLEILQYGEEAYFALESARLNDAIATAEQIVAQGQLNGLTGEALEYAQNYIAKLKEQAELRRKLSTVDAERRQVEAQKDTQKKIIENWDRTWNQVAQSMTNALIQGGVKTKDLLRNMFRTLILRPIIDPIMENIGKAISGTIGTIFSGGAQAGQFGGLLDGFGAGKSIFDGITQGFDVANTAFVDSIGRFGTWVSGLNGGSFTTELGSLITLNKGLIGDVLPYAGAILQLAQGNIKGAAFTAAGTAIGSAIFGPIGGAIGSFLGSAVGGLFGGKAKTKKSSTGVTTSYSGGMFSSSSSSGIAGYNRSLGGADALTSIGEAYSKTMGSLFKAFNLSDEVMTAASMFQRASKKIRTWVYWSATFGSGGGVDLGSMGGRQDAQATINQLIETVFTRCITEGVKNSNLPASIKLLFDGMVDKTQIANMVNTTIGLANANQALIDSFNITAEQAASVALQSGQVGDELGKVINAMIESARASRFAGDALYEFRGRLEDALGRDVYSSLKEYDNALKGIDKTTEEGIATFYDLFALRGDFMTFQTALDGLKGGVRGAIFSLVSDEQKLIMQQEDMARVFADLEQEIPASVQELIDLGKSIDFTTKEGLNLASIFPTLVQMFSQTKSTVDGLITSLSSLDSSRFRTLFEFTRAQAYVSNGISLNSLPSYAVGTNYVPNDGLAMIHQGERIIPASDNARLTDDMGAIVSEVRQLREEMQAQNVSIATSNAKMQKIFQRWDGEGIPYFRDVDGNGIVVDVNVTNSPLEVDQV